MQNDHQSRSEWTHVASDVSPFAATSATILRRSTSHGAHHELMAVLFPHWVKVGRRWLPTAWSASLGLLLVVSRQSLLDTNYLECQQWDSLQLNVSVLPSPGWQKTVVSTRTCVGLTFFGKTNINYSPDNSTHFGYIAKKNASGWRCVHSMTSVICIHC